MLRFWYILKVQGNKLPLHLVWIVVYLDKLVSKLEHFPLRKLYRSKQVIYFVGSCLNFEQSLHIIKLLQQYQTLQFYIHQIFYQYLVAQNSKDFCNRSIFGNTWKFLVCWYCKFYQTFSFQTMSVYFLTNHKVLRYVYVPFQSRNTEKQEKAIEPMFFQFHSEFNGPLRLKEGFYINLIREYFEKVSCTFSF